MGPSNFAGDGQPVAAIFPQPHSPGYFLWGYLKERVYHNKPDTIERLEENTAIEISRILSDILERAVNNFIVWMAAVIQQRGAWIEHFSSY